MRIPDDLPTSDREGRLKNRTLEGHVIEGPLTDEGKALISQCDLERIELEKARITREIARQEVQRLEAAAKEEKNRLGKENRKKNRELIRAAGYQSIKEALEAGFQTCLPHHRGWDMEIVLADRKLIRNPCNPSPIERPQMLTMTMVCERGWNKILIKQFLGEPDERVTHSRYNTQMQLYRLDRVERVEALAEFREIQESRRQRREGAQKALATKRQKIAEYVEAIEIEVPQLGREELVKLACDRYNAWQKGELWASERSDQEFLERICVNYLRHKPETKYHKHLEEIAGKVGTADAYLEIKRKVLEAISDEYYWLVTECSRQEKRMWDQEDTRLS